MTNSINFHSAAFLLSAPGLQHCPPDEGIEVAFAGRSNAGKSSALNALCGNGKLARTSKTPGRTQQINFFTLGAENLRFVDLPGYGYAKVQKSIKASWDRELEAYLQKRESLRGLVLLMDSRHPFRDYDRSLLQWAVDAELSTHVLLTKVDKLSRNQAANTLRDAEAGLANVADLVTVQLFSATKGTGMASLREKLSGWYGTPDQENQSIR